MSINNSNLANIYLTVEIITPDTTIFNGRAEMITVPSIEGELGFLPAHLPIIFQINEGLVKLYDQGLIKDSIFVNNGYGQLHNDKLTITCEYGADLSKTSKKQNELLLAELNEKIEQLNNAKTLQNNNDYNNLQNKLNRHKTIAKFFS